jgi:hypothetical protein
LAFAAIRAGIAGLGAAVGFELVFVHGWLRRVANGCRSCSGCNSCSGCREPKMWPAVIRVRAYSGRTATVIDWMS